MMQQRATSIRTLLLMMTSGLTLLIAVLTLHEVLVQWARLSSIHTLTSATYVSERFFDMLEDTSREREITFALLKAPDNFDARDLQTQLIASRQETDRKLQMVAQALPAFRGTLPANSMQDAQMDMARIAVIRAQVDKALALPRAQRDPALPAHLFSAATGLTGQVYAQWVGFTSHFTEIDPIVTQRMMFQHFLGLIIRYSGRERAMIGGLLVAGEPIDPATQAQLLQWRGIIDQGWEMCGLLATRSRLAPQILPYLSDAQSHYMTVYDMVEALFYVPGAPAISNYPIDIGQWLEVANGSTDSLVALKTAAMQQTRDYVESLEQRAKQRIIWQVAILAMALLLCAYSFYVILWRVIKPVRQMVAALADAAAGKSVQQLPGAAGRDDEIGKLADVLLALQQYMASRYLMASIVESSEDAILSKTLDGIITSWNRGAERIFGYSAAEAVGQHIFLIIPENRRNEEYGIVNKVRSNETVEHMETVRQGKGGKMVDVSLSVSPIRDAQGNIIGASKILRDISDRKQAEENLRRSEGRLKAVANNILDGLITINRRGIVESANPACERIFGYRAEELIGHNIKMLMPEPYHSEHDGYLAHYLDTGEARIIGTAGREVSGRRKDGSVFPMDLSVSAFELEDGMHFSGIIRDITERKKAEDELQRYTRDLERSNKELDDFAYIASHDLKEPLRGLHNHSRFLLEDNEGKFDEESNNRLHRLLYLTQRMEKLVNDLLYFSRLGRHELAIQPTDLNAVVSDIEDMSELLLQERHATIRVPQPLPTITCDQPRVTEALRNLIINAIKYNDKPEKIVEIGFLPEQRGPDGSLMRRVLYVKDNGVGIAREFHEEIFRIFKRLQNSAPGEDGTGVGLTFVKKIIERHGGRIWLESTPGEGTTFYFTLGRVSDGHQPIE